MANDHSEEGASASGANPEHIPHNSVTSESSSSPVKSSPTADHAPTRPTPSQSQADSAGPISDEDGAARTSSRRSTHASGHDIKGEEWAQIERLISRMFGSERKANSEEEKTRHVGVVWKNLTVKGVGLGAALQPTNGDIFLGLPRLIKQLFTRGRKGVGGGKPPIRTILDDFTVSLFPTTRNRLTDPTTRAAFVRGRCFLFSVVLALVVPLS
jgi:hypothetical protein